MQQLRHTIPFTLRKIAFFLVIAASISQLGIADMHAQLRFRYDVKNGIDVLREEGFAALSGKRIGLITNYTARTRDLKPTAEVLAAAEQVRLASIMTPEHGFWAAVRAGDAVADSTAPLLPGIRQWSLYGATRRPTKQMLDSLDAVVFDLQDIGVRSYTYLSTLYNAMDACAEYGVPLYVLDRPNPLGGSVVDGNVLDTALRSFVGIVPVPYIHGCTFGELAGMINDGGWLPIDPVSKAPRKCDLRVVAMQNWERWMTWEDTDFRWIPTSPNIPTVDAIRGCAALGIFGEIGLYSIGIGTALPFQYLGAPDVDLSLLTSVLGRYRWPGMIAVPTEYAPFFGKYGNEACRGILLSFPIDIDFKPYSAGWDLILAMRAVQPQKFTKEGLKEIGQKSTMFAKVTGSNTVLEMLMNGAPDPVIRETVRRGVAEFVSFREQYLLYP